MKKRYSEKDAQSRFCKKNNLIKSLTCLIVFFYLFSFNYSDLVIFGDYSLEIKEDTENSHNSENNKKLPI